MNTYRNFLLHKKYADATINLLKKYEGIKLLNTK